MTGDCTGSQSAPDSARGSSRRGTRSPGSIHSRAGRAHSLVAEAELPAALADPALARMLAEDCEPFDPCLPSRLEAPGSRMLVASENGAAIALGLLVPEAGGLALAALACADTARGHRALEPIVAAALATARRMRMALTALVPPHQDHALLLLDLLGFERRGRDRHGREIFCHALDDAAVRPAAEEQAWLAAGSTPRSDGPTAR